MLRHLRLILLCLALVLGGMSMGVVRGQAAAVSQGSSTITICSGYGVTTITLDAQGNPVGPVHLCPDCLAGLSAYLPPSLLSLTDFAGPSTQVTPLGHSAHPRAARVLVTRARGPPLVG